MLPSRGPARVNLLVKLLVLRSLMMLMLAQLLSTSLPSARAERARAPLLDVTLRAAGGGVTVSVNGEVWLSGDEVSVCDGRALLRQARAARRR